MTPHRFPRSIGTRSDKGERLGRFVLNGVYGHGTGRIDYRCYAGDGLPLITTSQLRPSYFLLRAHTHHIAHFFSVTSVFLQYNPILALHWGYTDYFCRFYLYCRSLFPESRISILCAWSSNHYNTAFIILQGRRMTRERG